MQSHTQNKIRNKFYLPSFAHNLFVELDRLMTIEKKISNEGIALAKDPAKLEKLNSDLQDVFEKAYQFTNANNDVPKELEIDRSAEIKAQKIEAAAKADPILCAVQIAIFFRERIALLLDYLKTQNETKWRYELNKTLYKFINRILEEVEENDLLDAKTKNQYRVNLQDSVIPIIYNLSEMRIENKDYDRALRYMDEALNKTSIRNTSAKETADCYCTKAIAYIEIANLRVKQNQLEFAAHALKSAEKMFDLANKRNRAFSKSNAPYQKAAHALALAFMFKKQFLSAVEWLKEEASIVSNKEKSELEVLIKICLLRHKTSMQEEINKINAESKFFQVSLNSKDGIEIKPNDESFISQKTYKVDELTVENLKIIATNLEREYKAHFDRANLKPFEYKTEYSNQNVQTVSIIKPGKEEIEANQDENKEELTAPNINEDAQQNTKPKNKKKGNSNSHSKNTQQQKQSQAEKLGFSKEFAKFTIYPLTSNLFPDGSYYAYYDASTDKDREAHTEVHAAHENQLKKGRIGEGVRIIGGMPDQFKTWVKNRHKTKSGPGNFRNWSQLAQTIFTPDGHQRKLLKFAELRDHDGQEVIYKKKSVTAK